ncbi:MAG: TIGR00304 family protein [Archaeoglobaceae archaeon]
MIWLMGLLLVFMGIILIISAFLAQEESKNEKLAEFLKQSEGKKYGGVVLIGPIPIVFGDAKLAIVAMVLAITLMLLSLILILGWFV